MTRTGTVTAFDSHRGLGEVAGSDGAVWPFHCVSIADGSRDIAVGQKVEFEVDYRVLRLEAVDIRKI